MSKEQIYNKLYIFPVKLHRIMQWNSIKENESVESMTFQGIIQIHINHRRETIFLVLKGREKMIQNKYC